MKKLYLISPYILIVFTFALLHFVFEFNGLYGQDAHDYFRFSKELRSSFLEGNSTGDFFWPVIYPALGAIISFSGISVLHALQLISLSAILGTLLYLNRSIQYLYGKRSTLFLLLSASSSVYFVRSGFIVMSDALCVFFVVGLYFHYLKYRNHSKLKDFVLIITLSAVAFFTRYASIPLIIVPVFHSVWLFIKNFNILLRSGILVLSLAGAVYLILLNNNLVDELWVKLTQVKLKNLFLIKSTFDGNEKTNTVPNLLYIWSNFAHPGYLSLGFLLFPWFRTSISQNRTLWMSLILYLLFIGLLPLQNQRFLVISHPLVLIVLFPAFSELRNRLKKRRLYGIFGLTFIALNTLIFVYSFSKTYQVHRVEKEIVAELKKYPATTEIYAFYVDQSFSSYDLPNKSHNLWLEEYRDFPYGSIVVFNPDKFADEKMISNVGKNWKKLCSDYTLTDEVDFKNGWHIYRIN